MRRIFRRPRIVVSKCIEFAYCRYNGDMISSDLVARLKEYVDFIPVCPEVEIGLGIPRPTLRIVRMGDTDHLVQPETDRDVSGEMTTFARRFLESLPEIDGFILKNKSPTSGLRDANVYPSAGKSAPIGHGPGFFGRMVLERYPLLPIEDEGRLRNVRIRDHFLTRIFTRADFREAKTRGKVRDLVRFHTENKYLLHAHNQRMLREMGIIVANQEGLPAGVLFDRYEALLGPALARPPSYRTNIDVLLHAMGHFRDRISPGERDFFLRSLERYRDGRASVCAPKNIVALWIERYDEEGLRNQTFFAPFPEDLIEPDPAETDRGRDFWKVEG
ncbi:MAG: DUF1722 domain-containing protein [Methanomicrobiales archaeon]|nr:DUF1722 domain-containing protein [Methanomicrobiales archaeon]NYT20690.1 DUF1722 domain-containing protein [Methanomicrobiales archaeon]